MNFDVPYTCNLSPDMEKKAQKELNEKAKWRNRDVQALRDMVLAHKGIKSRTDDAFLLRFLRARKFDYDRAYNLLVNYYSTREEYKEQFGELTPSAIKDLLGSGVSIVLPTKDREGRCIAYFRPGKWDPEKFPMFDILRNHMLNLEKIIQEEDNQVKGIVFLADLSNVTMGLVRHFDRNYFKASAAVMQDAFPLRLKALHMVNEPAMYSYIFSLIKPFLKSKTLERVKFHGADRDSLFKHIPKESLPSSVGGTYNEDADEIAKAWKKELEADEEYFQAMLPYNIELPRNITNMKTSETNVDEVVGTYKKLSVD